MLLERPLLNELMWNRKYDNEEEKDNVREKILWIMIKLYFLVIIEEVNLKNMEDMIFDLKNLIV